MKLCVFGAASPTVDEIYKTKTAELGEKLALAGHSLIFGGGKNGMMGAVAEGFMKHGAGIISVVPKFFLGMNVVLDGCDVYVNHDTLNERKTYMEDSADAFIVTPGGIGTFDELFEVITLNNLKQMDKPVIIYNINGFFTPLLAYIEECVRLNFISESVLSIYKVTDSADEIVRLLEK